MILLQVSDSRFALNINTLSIDPYASKKVFLQFNPDSIKNYNALLTVYSNAGTNEILLTGIGKDNAVNVEDELLTPLAFILEQNYPNPFNPGTKISWQSPVDGWQSLKVYDILGNEVITLVNEFRAAGSYSIEFLSDALLPSGVYFYQVQSGRFVETKKMILLK